MKNKIEIVSDVDLDQVRYHLQDQLSTTELAEFAINLGDKLTDEVDYYKTLRRKLNKLLV